MATKEWTLAEMLEKARVEAAWSQSDLWFHYRQAGGGVGLQTLEEYLRASPREPKVSQYRILSQVLNRRLEENGSAYRLPELPLRFTRVPKGSRRSQTNVRQPSLTVLNFDVLDKVS